MHRTYDVELFSLQDVPARSKDSEDRGGPNQQPDNDDGF